MRSKAAIKNFQFNIIVTFSMMLLQFISRKVFIENMGLELTGLMQLFNQLIGYLNLAELGLATASTYSLYKPLAEKNYNELEKKLYTIKYFYRIITFTILSLGLIMTLFLKFFIDTSINFNLINIYWLLFLINTVIGYTFVHYKVLLISDQKYYKVSVIQSVQDVIRPLIQIIIIVVFRSVTLYIITAIIFNIVQYMLYKLTILKDYRTNIRKTRLEKDIFHNTSFSFFHKFSSVLVSSTDYIIISKFISLKAVALYSNYLAVFTAVDAFRVILKNAIIAGVGNYLVEQNERQWYLLWKEINSFFYLVGSIICTITYIMINSFIQIWLGEQFILNNFIVLGMLINLFISIIKTPIDIFRDSSGTFKDIYNPVLEGILNLAVSLILVKPLGILGVVLGTVVSNIVFVYVSKPIYLFKRLFNLSWKNYVMQSMKYILLSSITIILTNYFVGFLAFDVENVLDWVLKATIVALICITCSMIFLVSKDFRKIFYRLIKVIYNLRVA